MSFRHFLVGKRLHNITANDSTPRTDALFVSPLALSHVGSTVSPRGYQGLPAFASLSMAGSVGFKETSGFLRIQTQRIALQM